MTGHDHTDALTEALRQPALPAEHAGEASAVASMAGALPTVLAAGRGRPRKGVAILAVTVASLGVGGLVAAGPGTLPRGIDFISRGGPFASSDESTANPPAPDVVPGGSSAAQPATPGAGSAASADPTTPAGAATAGDPPGTREDSDASGVGNTGGADARGLGGSDAEHCVEDGHGQTVADAAGSPSVLPPTTVVGRAVREVARPDCGMQPESPGGSNVGDNGTGATPEPAQTATPAQPATPPQPTTPPHPATPAQPATPPPTTPAQPASQPQPATPAQPANPPQPKAPEPAPPEDPGHAADAANGNVPGDG